MRKQGSFPERKEKMRSILLVLTLITLVGCGGASTNAVDEDAGVTVDGDVVVSPDSSTPDVVIVPVCGDGLVEGSEDCDDGENVDNDGCSALCVIENGWDCDDASPSVCAPVCGDSLVRGTETCDDGNTVTEACVYGQESCTVCNSVCTEVSGSAAYCGDSVVNGTEECDDNNTNEFDACTSTCEATSPVTANWVCVFNGYSTVNAVPPSCESNGYLPYKGAYELVKTVFTSTPNTVIDNGVLVDGYFEYAVSMWTYRVRVCYSTATVMPTNTVTGGNCVAVAQ